jgi:hypothetical protein
MKAKIHNGNDQISSNANFLLHRKQPQEKNKSQVLPLFTAPHVRKGPQHNIQI